MGSAETNEGLLACVQKYGVLATLRTRLRATILEMRRRYLVTLWGMDIHSCTLVSWKASLDRTYPKGVHIGEGTAVSFDAVILTHDHVRGRHCDTWIGKYCQIGARSMIMPGVRIGDHSIVGAGAIVTKDVPPGSIVVGNPARIIRTGIMTGQWGKMTDRGQDVR